MVVVYCGTPDVRLLANSGSMADVAGDRPRPIAEVRVARDALSALNGSRYFPATNNRRWKPFWNLSHLNDAAIPGLKEQALRQEVLRSAMHRTSSRDTTARSTTFCNKHPLLGP